MLSFSMRPEGNPLDLNNLPEEYGKQNVEESLTTTAASNETIRFKKKKGGAKDDSSRVYECRFCSLKFCKSQALGGHMNRHRQERETETLDRARQLVFSNEGLAGAGASIGYRDVCGGGQFRPLYPRVPSQTSPQPPTEPYMYPSSYQPPPHPSVGEYVIGHVLPSSTQRPPHHHQSYGLDSSNYACFGAPLTHGFPVEGFRAPQVGREGGSGNQGEGRNTWNCGSSSRDLLRDVNNI